MLASAFLRSSASSFIMALALSLTTGCANAQAQKKPFEPEVGQPGKDVVWVPTPQAVVDKMLDMAKVTKDDFLMDLGSGDGRTVITAAKRGARALGIEYNPDMVDLSKRNAEAAGMTSRAQFQKADLFQTDFSKASVITMFLLPDINLKLRPKILNLKPGTRIVSNTFTMGDWQPDESATVDQGCDGSWCHVLFWVVPAKVSGSYKIPQGDLTLKQSFQNVTGTLSSGGRIVPVEGKLRGDEIFLTAGNQSLHGKVNGKTIEMH